MLYIFIIIIILSPLFTQGGWKRTWPSLGPWVDLPEVENQRHRIQKPGARPRADLHPGAKARPGVRCGGVAHAEQEQDQKQWGGLEHLPGPHWQSTAEAGHCGWGFTLNLQWVPTQARESKEEPASALYAGSFHHQSGSLPSTLKAGCPDLSLLGCWAAVWLRFCAAPEEICVWFLGAFWCPALCIPPWDLSLTFMEPQSAEVSVFSFFLPSYINGWDPGCLAFSFSTTARRSHHLRLLSSSSPKPAAEWGLLHSTHSPCGTRGEPAGSCPW